MWFEFILGILSIIFCYVQIGPKTFDIISFKVYLCLCLLFLCFYVFTTMFLCLCLLCF